MELHVAKINYHPLGRCLATCSFLYFEIIHIKFSDYEKEIGFYPPAGGLSRQLCLFLILKELFANWINRLLCVGKVRVRYKITSGALHYLYYALRSCPSRSTRMRLMNTWFPWPGIPALPRAAALNTWFTDFVIITG